MIEILQKTKNSNQLIEEDKEDQIEYISNSFDGEEENKLTEIKFFSRKLISNIMKFASTLNGQMKIRKIKKILKKNVYKRVK